MSQFNSNSPIPILFLGDAPDSHTGLGRIGHDLAWLVSSMPEFQVGYLAKEGFGRSRFPWTQYCFRDQWGEDSIQQAWEDLAGNRRGIIFTCWDASRLLWFADGQGTGLEGFLNSGKFQRWGYFMADGSGVLPDALPLEQAHVISRYHRAVMASEWAYRLVKGINGPELDWLPHPLNRQIFCRRDRLPVRSCWGIGEERVLIGCVMGNQARKHWPVVMEAIALFSREMRPRPMLWVHTNSLLHYWNLTALAAEYGISNQIFCENRGLSDTELALRYAACDATVVISGGEGFCYPVAESLSCGVPAVTGSYGAQAELTQWTVKPVTTVIDTSHNVRRAIYSPDDVARALAKVLEERPRPQECEHLVSYLDMPWLSVQWKKWLKKGIS
jgi:glycosyltransferase involved in cell wall biosynthesis